MGADVLKKIFYSNSNSHIRQEVAETMCSVLTCVTGDDEEAGSLKSFSSFLHFPLLISSFSFGITSFFSSPLPLPSWLLYAECINYPVTQRRAVKPSLRISSALFLVIPPQTTANKAPSLKRGVTTLCRSLWEVWFWSLKFAWWHKGYRLIE